MKRSYPQEGVVVLEKYLERGQLALAALLAGKFERAERFLQRQTVAFHNFRAIDRAAQESGVNLMKVPEVRGLVEQVLQQDSVLTGTLNGRLKSFRDELIQVHGFRKHLRQYRAKQQPGKGFRQCI